MSDIVTDCSAASMAAAIERNVYARLQSFGMPPKGQLVRQDGLFRFSTGIPAPLYNGVFDAHLDVAHADAMIEQELAYFRRAALPMYWFLGPSSEPSDLGDRLTSHGLKRGGPPGMAVDLSDLHEFPAPAGLAVQQVQDVETLRVWVHTTSVSFALSSDVERGLFELMTAIGYALPSRLYLGLLDGEPVATSKLYLAAGVAGIYWVGTVPEARRRGVGTAITLAPLRQARAMGYRIAILEAFEMGQPVYRRIGFREYTQVARYQWLPEEASG